MNNKLNFDGRPDVKHHGSIVYARNKVLDSSGTSLNTEDGFNPILTIQGEILSIKVTNYDIVVFSKNGTFDTIGYYNFKTKVYTEVIVSEYLTFTDDNLIHAINYYNYKNELVINWVDGVADDSNNIRSLNLMHVPFPLDANKELVDPKDIDILNFNPNVSIPVIDLLKIGTQGNLLTGSYIIFVKYIYDDFRETGWLNSSNPITIYKDAYSDTTFSTAYTNVTGNEPGETTNKSIHLVLSNLSDNIKYVKVAILRSNNLVKTVYTKTVQATGTTLKVNITTTDTLVNTSLDDILLPRANYTKASSITAYQNRAIYAGVIAPKDIGIQKFINNIKVEWLIDTTSTFASHAPSSTVTPESTFKNSQMLYYNKSFTPFEVVAFYIRLYNLDGSVLGDYHIPGRAAKILNGSGANALTERALLREFPATGHNEISLVGNVSGFEDGRVNDYNLGSDVRYFQTRNTATVNSGTQGDMGYWENANEYYEDADAWDVWDVDINGDPRDTGVSLRNDNIRHHRFPSQRFMLDSNMVSTTNTSKPILGAKFTQIDLPTEIKDKISGYKIMYAVRTGLNNTVQDETLLHHTITPVNQCASADFRYYQPIHISDGTTNNQYVLRPFTSINNNDPILTDYVTTNYLVRSNSNLMDIYLNSGIPDDNVDFLHGKGVPLTNNTIGNGNGTLIKSAFGANQSYDILKVVDKCEYLNREALIDNVYNAKGDTVLLLQTKDLDSVNGFDFKLSYTDDGETGWFRNISMMMYKEDCYINYDGQNLARGSDFIPIVNETIDINSGDTFVGLHGYRLTSQICIGTASINADYSLYTIPAYSNTSIELRHTIGYDFYPNLNDNLTSTNDFIISNYWKYNPTLVNPDFNILNYIKPSLIFNTTNGFINTFPYRYIISDINNAESLNNNWNSVRFNSYRDTDITKGFITSVVGAGVTLYINKRDSTYTLTLRDVLSAIDVNAVGIESNDVFNASVREVISADTNGYIGSKEYFNNVVTKYGYCIFDSDKQRMFIVNGIEAKDITSGVYSFLTKFKSAFEDSICNPVKGSGLVVSYNDKDDMLLLSFSDGKCERATQICPGLTPIAKAFTLSYNFSNKGWLSTHVYLPDLADFNRYNLFTVKNNIIYQHNDSAKSCVYYKHEDGTYIKHDDVVDYIFNSLLNQTGQYYAQNTIKVFNAFNINADVITVNDDFIYDRQNDMHAAYNDTQCTGYIIDKPNTNWFKNDGFRIVDNIGHFNALKDVVTNDKIKFMDTSFNFITSNLGQRNFFDMSIFISKFIVLRMVHINSDKVITEKIYITDVDAIFDRQTKINTKSL